MNARAFIKKQWVRAALILAVVALAGVASNEISKHHAEASVARELDSSGRKYFVQWPEGFDPGKAFPSLMRLDEKGLFVKGETAFVRIQSAKQVAPFILSVDWDWLVAENYGARNRCFYLSLFGRNVKLRCSVTASY